MTGLAIGGSGMFCALSGILCDVIVGRNSTVDSDDTSATATAAFSTAGDSNAGASSSWGLAPVVAVCSFGSAAGGSSSAPLPDFALRIKTFLSKFGVPENLSIGASMPAELDHVMTHKQAGKNKCRIPSTPE
jgi:hypothetical protein